MVRVFRWRSHLAAGAWAKARREIDRLKGQVDSTAKLSLALANSQKELEERGKRLSAARERASQLAAQVTELQGFREQLDKARSELSQIKAEHDDQVKVVQQHFEKRWTQLEASHAEDKNSWNKRLEEAEGECRRQRDQLADSNKRLTEAENQLERSRERVAQLCNELDYAHEEVGDGLSRIEQLEENLRQAQSAKSKALNRVQELNAELTRRAGETQRLGSELAGREEEIRKMGFEFQERLKTFGEEMASNHRKNSELEKKLAEASARASSAVETYKGSAQFLEERREACADAFRFCEEDIRARISRVHPDWDLSFLDVEAPGASTSRTEEAEYEDASDVDLEAILGPSETAVPEGHRQPTVKETGVSEEHRQPAIEETATSEVGETGQAPPDVAEGAAGTDSTLNP